VPEEFEIFIHTPLPLLIRLLIIFTPLDVLILIVFHATGVVRFISSIRISLDVLISIRFKLGLLAGPQSPPYLFTVIGSQTIPFALLMRSVSFHTSLQRSDTVSHGRSDVAFTWARVCHAVAGESPSLASFHPVELT
jgi:hypothetical protein